MNISSNAAQVRQFGRPQTRTASHVPKITDNLDNMKGHELRALAHTLEKCTRDGSISDLEIKDYFKFIDDVNSRLAVVEAQTRTTHLDANSKPSAPAYHKSVGDSEGSLAKRFSISKAILTAAEGRQLEGVEAEVTSEGRRQFAGTRGQVVIPNFVLAAQQRTVYGNDSGQSGIGANVTGKQTLAAGYQAALHVQPLAEQLGARVVDALGSSTMLIPFLGRTAAGSADEGAAVTSSATFSELSLAPSRYARVATYSSLALRTTGQALDDILTRDFQQAHTSAHDKVAFDAIRANATYTLATENGTNGLEATTLSNVFELTKDVMSATGTNDAPAIVCSPEGYKVMNTTAVSGLQQTLASAYNMVTGQTVRQATNLADGNFAGDDVIDGADGGTIAGAGLVIAGDFGSCVIAKWGGIDVVIDPFSGNESGLITLAANSYCAAGITRDAFRALAVAGSTIAAT